MNQMPVQASVIYMVQALSSILNEQDKEDISSCCMQSLKFYIDQTQLFRQNQKRLFIAWNKFFPGISQKTPSLTAYG